jgi:hypothetical protein
MVYVGTIRYAPEGIVGAVKDWVQWARVRLPGLERAR